MPTYNVVADYIVVLDLNTTPKLGDPKTLTFSAGGSSLRTSERGIVQFTMNCLPQDDTMTALDVSLNGRSLIEVFSLVKGPVQSLHAVIPGGLLANSNNKLVFTVTSGNGILSINNVVVWVQVQSGS